jgi:hypothetical protein
MSLAKTMKEQVEHIRNWAFDHAVQASRAKRRGSHRSGGSAAVRQQPGTARPASPALALLVCCNSHSPKRGAI